MTKRHLILLMCVLFLPVGIMAQEAYAVYTDDGTLTFFYDNQKGSRNGVIFELNTGDDYPSWHYQKDHISKVEFKPSFANARPTSTSRWFDLCYSLTVISGIQYLNTSSVTNMEYMFCSCSSLTNLDLSNFDTSKATNMGNLFQSCWNLKKIDLSNFDTSKVTDMSWMFYDCVSLTELDLSSFNTGSVTDMSYMFANAYPDNLSLPNESQLTKINVSSFDTKNVTDMSHMFYNCYNLVDLDVSRFNTGKVTNMNSMFEYCGRLANLDLSKFDTKNVTDMSSMFWDCKSLVSLDVNGFNTGKVTNMSGMFGNCHNLTNLDVSKFDTKNVTDMSYMFYECNSLVSLDVRGVNTGKVTNMNKMFENCGSLVNLDVSGLNTIAVTDMGSMFGGCGSLTNLDLSGFNTGSVTDMSYMFARCSNLTNVDISSFDTKSVTNMRSMFSICNNLTNVDLSRFDTNNVTDMTWMFNKCRELSTIYIGEEWSIDKVTNSKEMFYNCFSLIGGQGTKYDSEYIDITYACIDGGPSNPGYFTKKIIPSINLTVNERHGLLVASFNSISNDLRYRLNEKSSTGARRKLYETHRSHYPNTIRTFDILPADGTYSYYVSAVYTDENGNEKGVKSNEVSITFKSDATEEDEPKYGSIVGRVTFNNMTEFELAPHINIDVVFSDDGSKVRLEPNGTFHRDGITIGQSVTLHIEDDDYFTYKPITLVVTEDTQNEVQVIEATARENINVTVSENSFDLKIENFVNAAPEYFEMDVVNTKNQPWTGIMELIAFKSKDAKKIEKLMDSGVSFSTAKPFFIVGRAYIEKLSTGATKHLKIEITDFPALKNDEYYKFYFVSKRSEQSMSSNYKIVSFRDKDLHNPMEVLMTAQEPKYKSVKFPEIPSELDAYLMDVFDTMKTFDKIDGPMGEVCQKLAELMEQYERKRDLEEFYGNLPDILKSFKVDLANAVKDVKDFTDIFEKARKFYKELETAYNLLNPNKTKRDEVKSFVTICKKIWELSGDPFSKIYCCYLDVLEKSADKILKLQEKLVDAQIDDIFNNNEITFKLRVAHERNIDDYITFSTYYYGPEYVDDRIKDIEIHMVTMKPYATPELTQIEYSSHPSNGIESWAAYQVSSYDGDAVVLRRDNSRSMINVNMDYTMVRFWMKIRWKNGRVSTIPLYRDCTDWDITGQGARAVITVTLESTTYPMDDKIYLKY